MQPLWDRLPELAIPVTLIVGERDAKFRAHRRRDARSGYRTRSSWWCRDAGHAVQLEQPAAVAEAIHQSFSPSSSASA